MIKKTSKYPHALVVSSILCKLAEKLGEDKGKWKIVGLLHDLDYNKVRDDVSKHGVVANQLLEGKLPPDCLYAIRSHDYRSGFKPKSKLDKGLIIADSLAVVIEKMKSKKLSLEKIKEEIKMISKEKPWIKANIMKCEEVGVNLNQLLQIARAHS